MVLMQIAPVLLRSKRDLARAVGLCRKAKAIAVDCEGCKLSAEGKLCLIQVTFANALMSAYSRGHGSPACLLNKRCFIFTSLVAILRVIRHSLMIPKKA